MTLHDEIAKLSGDQRAALAEKLGARGRASWVDNTGPARLVAYVTTSADADVDGEQLTKALRDQLPAHMVPSAVVELDALPRMPNGKIDRGALEDMPSPVASARPLQRSSTPVRPERPKGVDGQTVSASTGMQSQLTAIFADTLGIDEVRIDDNFFDLGGDSILSILIVAKANQAGIRITPKQLFERQTVAELCTALGETPLAAVEEPPEAVVDDDRATGHVPLVPIQRWFFEQTLPDRHHWNQAVILCCKRRIETSSLAAALRALTDHHDVLRMRFLQTGAGWDQVLTASADPVPITTLDLTEIASERVRDAIEREAATLQAQLELDTPPLVRAAYFRLADDASDRLLLVFHHLVTDGVSWQTILEDLELALSQLAAGEPVELPVPTASYKRWADGLFDLAISSELADQADYWLAQSDDTSATLPSDFDTVSPGTVADAESITVTVDAQLTAKLLRDAPKLHRASINDVLLTAVAVAFERWTGERRLLIDLESHGREDIVAGVDLSRTIGWFTSLFPLLLDWREAGELRATLRTIKDQFHRTPNRGIGYGILRYLGIDTELRDKLRRAPQPRVYFNYLGQLDGLLRGSEWFTEAHEDIGLENGPDGYRSHSLEINCHVRSGKLVAEWTYATGQHTRDTIEQLANGFTDALTALAALPAPARAEYVPSDFPAVDLTVAELDRLANSVGNDEIETIYPLTPMQEGMLFHTLDDRAGGSYVVQLRSVIEGNIDVDCLRQAWQQTVNRHPALRTQVHFASAGAAVQLVRTRARLDFDELDHRGKSQAETDAFIEADRVAAFALDHAPLFRLTLIRYADNRCELVWCCHHLALDGWSGFLIQREAFARYDALVDGVDYVASAAAPPFADFVGWLGAQDTSAARAFWTDTLAAISSPTEFGVDKAETQRDSQDVAVRELVLSDSQTSKLTEFARSSRLTLNTLLQATWGLVLSRYSGNRQVMFGAVDSGRAADIPGIDSMVGNLINTLPVKVDVNEDSVVGDWLRVLQAEQTECRRFGALGLVDIQGCSAIPRGTPLFESIVIFENIPDTSDRSLADGVRVREHGSVERTHFPLNVVVLPGPQLTIRLEYNIGRFSAASIERMAGHLSTLLTALPDFAHDHVAALPMLTDAERAVVLKEWNDTSAEYPHSDLQLHQHFERRVAQAPEGIAVVYGRRQLTYKQLNQEANDLAHRLRQHGVGPDVLVGICAERSLELVIGLYAILKAGGAYVPLDPEYPKERLAHMLEDAPMAVILTQRHLAGALPGSKAQVLWLDPPGPADAQQHLEHGDENIASDTTGENLAYVIFTSGSTGRPKGVMITHEAICNRLLWMQAEYQLTEADVVLQKTPYSFDVSVWEFFWPLLAGARLVLAKPDGHRDTTYLVELIREHKITTLHFVPSMLRMFLGADDVEACDSLRRVICSGEALAAELRDRFFERLRCELHNLYGPTEAAVDVTYWECQRDDTRRTVPIGRPVANTQIYLLDGRLEPVPVGVAGELHIGGVQVGLGYVGRPQLTTERFVPDPFSSSAGARLYKTGDLARFLSDGSVEYLGRIDDQVKLRGFRIELGEIEVVLTEHDAVAWCVAAVRENRMGDMRLVAYFVPEPGGAVTATDLRKHLRSKLPEYMIPQHVIELDAIPKTPSGKIDRKALPSPAGSTPAAEYVAPRTPTEIYIARAWQEALDIERVGVDNFFFEIGGHSLLAMGVIARIERETGVQISTRQILLNSLEQLALQCPLPGETASTGPGDETQPQE